MKHVPCSSVAAAVLALAAASAHAGFVDNATGLSAPEQTLTFDDVVLDINQPVSDQFSAYGVTFSSAFANPNPVIPYPNVSGNRLSNFQSDVNQDGTFTMTFASALSQIAFALISSPGTSTFRAFLGDALVETESTFTTFNNPVNFFGFTNIVFDRITIDVVSSDRAFVLDNLQTVGIAQSVPEPETWALMLAGLVGMGALRARRAVVRQTSGTQAEG